MQDLETIYENMLTPSVPRVAPYKDANNPQNIYMDKPDTEKSDEEETEEEPQIDLTDFKTEAQIADDIIKEMKILRRKVGKDSYYRASKILRLAEKLKAMHPEKVALP